MQNNRTFEESSTTLIDVKVVAGNARFVATDRVENDC